MDQYSLANQLAELPIPDIRYFDTVSSTNDVALSWAENGASDGSLVIADAQSAGRGRMGRRWVTNPGSALALSLILRPTTKETNLLLFFSPLGALAVRDALQECYGLNAKIKWPNDVLLNNKKIAGILVEAAWNGNTLHAIIVGIGVNVAPNSVPPADQLLFPATSVEQVLGRTVDRIDLLHAVLKKLIQWRPDMHKNKFRNTWEKHLAFIGQWVEIKNRDQNHLVGQVVGISRKGNLRLLTRAGKEMSIAIGDVHLRPAEDNLKLS